jgi:hypothetical protein
MTKVLDNPYDKIKGKKFVIIGFAPSYSEVPWDEILKSEEHCTVAVNEFYKVAPKNARFTFWSEIHDPKSPSKQNKEHQNFLVNCKIPLIMQSKFEEYPASIPYPLQEVLSMVNENMIIDELSSSFTNYSNQITYLIALGILYEAKEIHIYGVDMAAEGEYQFQRQSCEALIGFALGRGIKIRIPASSELCKNAKLYGFESDNANRHWAKKRKQLILEELNKLRQAMEQVRYGLETNETTLIEYQKRESALLGQKDQLNHMINNNIL